MLILRIEIAKKVYYNVNLGDAYIKVADIENCDADYSLGQEFHDILSDVFDQSDDFVPNVIIFKKGKISWDNLVNFVEIFGKAEFPQSIRCWIMNDKGDTIESIIIQNICETDDDDEPEI